MQLAFITLDPGWMLAGMTDYVSVVDEELSVIPGTDPESSKQ